VLQSTSEVVWKQLDPLFAMEPIPTEDVELVIFGEEAESLFSAWLDWNKCAKCLPALFEKLGGNPPDENDPLDTGMPQLNRVVKDIVPAASTTVWSALVATAMHRPTAPNEPKRKVLIKAAMAGNKDDKFKMIRDSRVQAWAERMLAEL